MTSTVTLPLSITMHSQTQGSLKAVVKLLTAFAYEYCYAYERESTWHVGVGNLASLVVDPTGTSATVKTDTGSSFITVNRNIKEIVAKFIAAHCLDATLVFGHVGFNYASYIRGIEFAPGTWPLVSIMIPRMQIDVRHDALLLRIGSTEDLDLIKTSLSNPLPQFESKFSHELERARNEEAFITMVQQALDEIDNGLYQKVIASRSIDILSSIDMVGTLLRGRCANTPKRTFFFSHFGFRATGFSPELVMSVENGTVTPEPLAGTRSNTGSEAKRHQLRNELLSDPKEIEEHAISVKEAMQELSQFSIPGTVAVKDFMSIRERGNVQHLGSTVTGVLSSEKDVWDAFDVLFPSITATGIPKMKAIEAIHRLEERPRELYSGAVLLWNGPHDLEASLVLRSAFQDPERNWLQAGAGIIALSNAERELTETSEKLQCIEPFIVPG